ncbi:hypothetical protein Tco_0951110 [Tanacetum coccineum]|uniref:Uncharacterized protein n=1 Tax=Tanacetum coccineum TaxID=301880 RepID=A0ABQ5DT73_9ASTR
MLSEFHSLRVSEDEAWRLDPSQHEPIPSVNKIHGSWSFTSLWGRTASVSGFLMRKSASICPGHSAVGSAAICCLSSVKASSASVVQRKSPFFVHFLSVLNKGSDLSADLDRNLFKRLTSHLTTGYFFQSCALKEVG